MYLEYLGCEYGALAIGVISPETGSQLMFATYPNSQAWNTNWVGIPLDGSTLFEIASVTKPLRHR
jgi:hypothetical protein